MDELTEKRVQTTIKQLEKSGKKVINTKYLPTFINHEDFKLSQIEIEDYLKKEDYISISDDYMVYRPDFIKYCVKNNLNTISKLKKNIFIDYSVPYITLSETQLQEILKDSYIYCSDKSDRKTIIAKHLREKYIINNRKDLIEYGLKKTYISYELLEDFCNIHPNENPFELTYILQDRNIKLSSKKIEYYIDDIVEVGKVAEDEDRIVFIDDDVYKNKLLAYKSDICINENINSKERNVIINLRLNEIIATFINLGYLGEQISYSIAKEYFLPKHLVEFEKLHLIKNTSKKKKRSNYVVAEECLKISNKIISLTDLKPNRNLFLDTEISNSENVDFLFHQIRNDFIKVLKKFDSFRFLFNLIEDINRIEKYSMMDILKYCIVNGYKEEFLWIFIGKGASGGRKSIHDGKDICCLNIKNGLQEKLSINCLKCYERYGMNNSNYKTILLDIREDRANKIYKEIENDVEAVDLLLEDPIALKFLVRFGITYYNKNILRAMGIFNSRAYMKSSGEYCPFIDEWRMNNYEI